MTSQNQFSFWIKVKKALLNNMLQIQIPIIKIKMANPKGGQQK